MEPINIEINIDPDGYYQATVADLPDGIDITSHPALTLGGALRDLSHEIDLWAQRLAVEWITNKQID